MREAGTLKCAEETLLARQSGRFVRVDSLAGGGGPGGAAQEGPSGADGPGYPAQGICSLCCRGRPPALLSCLEAGAVRLQLPYSALLLHLLMRMEISHCQAHSVSW